MKNNTVIAFDLDDTLYKERDYVLAAYRLILERYGDYVADNVKSTFLSIAKPYEAFEYFCRQVPQADIEEIKFLYRSGNIPLEDTEGAIPLLEYLKSYGYITAVITDGFSARQRAKLSSLGIDNLIDAVIISEETGFDKHTPEPFLGLMEINPDTERFYYIGDNPDKDFYYPNIMGWHTVMILDNYNYNIHIQHTLLNPSFSAKTIVTSLSAVKHLL